jgi:hypothetical protein
MVVKVRTMMRKIKMARMLERLTSLKMMKGHLMTRMNKKTVRREKLTGQSRWMFVIKRSIIS